MLLTRASLFLFLFFFTIACAAQDGSWDRLLQLHQDFLTLRDAGMKDAAHDFSPIAIQARAVQLKECSLGCVRSPHLLGRSIRRLTGCSSAPS
jgi:hypothetical protein